MCLVRDYFKFHSNFEPWQHISTLIFTIWSMRFSFRLVSLTLEKGKEKYLCWWKIHFLPLCRNLALGQDFWSNLVPDPILKRSRGGKSGVIHVPSEETPCSWPRKGSAVITDIQSDVPLLSWRVPFMSIQQMACTSGSQSLTGSEIWLL